MSKRATGNSVIDWFSGTTITGEERTQILLDKLKGKYGEEFDIKPGGNAWGQKVTVYKAWPIGQEDRMFEVQGWVNPATGTYESSDAYYCVIIRDEYVEFIENAVREVFPECKINFLITAQVTLPDELVKGVPLAEACDLTKPGPLIDGEVTVMAKDDGTADYEERYMQIKEKIGAMIVNQRLNLYIVDDEFYDSNGNEQESYTSPKSGIHYFCGASFKEYELYDRRDEFVYYKKK